MNSRLLKDTITIVTETFPLDVVGGWQRVDGATLATSACVQAANLDTRAMALDESTGIPFGVGQSTILLAADPGSLIYVHTKITHTSGPNGAITPPVVYAAEGRAVPPGGGMTYWTVAVKREG